MTASDPATKSSSAGFTLLEIMVSIAVMGIVLVTIFQLQSSTVRLAAAGRFHNLAPLLAKKQLEIILSDPSATSAAGGFEDDFPGFAWEAQVKAADFEPPVDILEAYQKNLRQITLSVTGPGANEAYTITTWRLFLDHDRD